MSFAKIIHARSGRPVVFMCAANSQGNWEISGTTRAPDGRLHTHALTFEGEDGEGPAEQLYSELNSTGADAVEGYMFNAVAAGRQ